jgi:uncharacterized membrane protein
MRWLIDMTLGRAARCFVAGVLAILPLVITVVVVAWAGGFVTKFLGPNTLVGQAVRRLGLPFATNDMTAYAVGAALVLAVIFLLGAAVETGAKSLVQRLQDAILQRIPIIGSVYGTSKQLVGIMDKKGDDNLKGMRCVFCNFGGASGGGVLALLVSPERFRLSGQDYHIVIVPTAPVPVGGGLLFVPVEKVQPVDVSVEGLMSIYVSMGITAPQYLPRLETRPVPE